MIREELNLCLLVQQLIASITKLVTDCFRGRLPVGDAIALVFHTVQLGVRLLRVTSLLYNSGTISV